MSQSSEDEGEVKKMFKFSAIVFDLDCQEDSNFFCSMFAEKLESDVCEKIWSGVDEDDIIEQITESTGWCVESFACEEVFEGGEIKGDGEPDEVKVSMKLDALLDTYYEAGFDKEYILGLLIQVRDVDFCKEYFSEFYDGEESEGDGADGGVGELDDADGGDPTKVGIIIGQIELLSCDELTEVVAYCQKIKPVLKKKERDARAKVVVKKGVSVLYQKWLIERKKYLGMEKPSPKKVGQYIYQNYRKWNEPNCARYVGDKYQVDEDEVDVKKDDDEADVKKDDDEADVEKDDDDEAGAKE